MFCVYPQPHYVIVCHITWWYDKHILSWVELSIKMSSYQYRKSRCGDKRVLRSSYLHNGISYTGKMSSLYWIGALVFKCKVKWLAISLRHHSKQWLNNRNWSLCIYLPTKINIIFPNSERPVHLTASLSVGNHPQQTDGHRWASLWIAELWIRTISRTNNRQVIIITWFNPCCAEFSSRNIWNTSYCFPGVRWCRWLMGFLMEDKHPFMLHK